MQGASIDLSAKRAKGQPVPIHGTSQPAPAQLEPEDLRMRPRLPWRHRAGLPALALVSGCLLAGDLQAQTQRCTGEVESHLAELPLAPGDIKSVRIIERVNLEDENGPDILGVDTWVRLNSCSGWLAIVMTRSCFVRQTYTRGDCRVEGLPNY
jgi:hypothetical protein